MMRRMASKGIYESIRVNLEVGNIADNLNNCKEFAVTARGLRRSLKDTSQKQDEKSNVATSYRPNREI